MIKYRKYTETGYEETLIKPTSGKYEEIEFNPEEDIIKKEIEVKRQSLLNDILSLEAQVTARRRDEAMLSGDYSFIADIRKQIEAKRNELPVQPEYPEEYN